ncbi:unnamed protein product [Schistosoma curassoni]|uniref:Uncharacterized protein n=1 Tax=Schistosoma curassoni TaxID=6186 RepID=A0A183JZ21_9TREM|nr:unnamed protein product [Schistosoma curassoni]
MVAGDQRSVHTPFVPSGYWGPCASLVWSQGFPTPLGGLSMFTNPVKAPEIRFSSSQFCKQHPRHEKAVSRTSLVESIYAWPCESISSRRADSPHSRSYQGIWGRIWCGNIFTLWSGQSHVLDLSYVDVL